MGFNRVQKQAGVLWEKMLLGIEVFEILLVTNKKLLLFGGEGIPMQRGIMQITEVGESSPGYIDHRHIPVGIASWDEFIMIILKVLGDPATKDLIPAQLRLGFQAN